MTSKRATGLERLSQRAASYNMPGDTIDGNNVIAVYETAGRAVERARAGEGPTLLECITYRWRGHHAGESEDGLFYRAKEEVETWKKKDPIEQFQTLLLKDEVISEDQINKMEEEIQQEMDEAIEYANKSPYPEIESIYKNVFVEKE